MIYIKKLGVKPCSIGIHTITFHLFKCPYCNRTIERGFTHGTRAKSCGCMKSEWSKHSNFKHGDYKHPLYKIWGHMKDRCYVVKCQRYNSYGGRGIRICDEWKEDYFIFKKWALENGFKEGLTIDRIDVNGNYEPTNCQFLTYKENSRYKRHTKLNWEKVGEIRKKYKSGQYTQVKLSQQYGVHQTKISQVVNNHVWVM